MTESVMTSGLQLSDKLGDNLQTTVTINSDEFHVNSTDEQHKHQSLSPIDSNTSHTTSQDEPIDDQLVTNNTINNDNTKQFDDVLSDSHTKCSLNSTTDLCANKWSEQTKTRQDKCDVKRVQLDDKTLMSLTHQQLIHHWHRQQLYINDIELQLKQLNRDKSDLISLRESEEKLKLQQLDANRRENVLVMRLTTKEQEMHDCLTQIQELNKCHVPSTSQLQCTLIDPAINMMFDKMKQQVDTSRAKVDEMQNELNAWKFTADSTTGKRLMAKCRLLYQENEELGKMIASGRIAKLEGELALQKNFSDELKKSQSEIDEFLLELDEDVEGMQNTIYYLQQQLKEAKDKLAKYESNDNTSLNQINDRQCVQQNCNNSSVVDAISGDMPSLVERTLDTSSSSSNSGDHLNDGIVNNNCIDGHMNDNNCHMNDNNCHMNETIDDSVNLTKTSLTVNTHNSETTVDCRADKLVNNNNNNNNYLSVVNKTTNILNNDCIKKRTSYIDANDDHLDIDDDYKQPSVKVVKLNDKTSANDVVVADEDSCSNETNHSNDLTIKSSDSLISNTHQTNCIEINGQSNR